MSGLDLFPNSRPVSVRFYEKMPYNNNPFRLCKITLLLASLMNNEKFKKIDIEEQDDILEIVEKSCKNIAIQKAQKESTMAFWDDVQFKKIYSTLVTMCAMELDTEFNKVLSNKCIDGVYKWNEIAAVIDSGVVYLETKTELVKIINERKNVELSEKTSDLYKCGNCGARKSTGVDVQTRGLDEEKTSFRKCCECDYRWKYAG